MRNASLYFSSGGDRLQQRFQAIESFVEAFVLRLEFDGGRDLSIVKRFDLQERQVIRQIGVQVCLEPLRVDWNGRVRRHGLVVRGRE